MFEIILNVKAEAERELLLAQAKIEVANSIIEQYNSIYAVAPSTSKEIDETSDFAEGEVVEVVEETQNQFLS